MKRDYGLDIYKIIATFMVFILHVADQGGVIRGVHYASSQYIGVWFLIAFAYCAVNCFGLASGYLLVNHQFKYHRIIVLWLEVLFYSLGINIVFSILCIDDVSLGNWISAFFPVLLREYWYFTAYFGMFFFIPFFNKLLKALNKKQLVSLLLTIIFVISVLSSINREIFYLKSGYSMLWLCSLYIIGGIIRILDIHLSTKFKVGSMVLCVIFALLAVLSRMIIHQVTLSVFNEPKFEGALYLYVSPLILFEGIVVLLICKDIRVTRLKKLMTWLSSTSFGCYLIQVHPLVFEFFRNKFTFLSHQNMITMVVGILMISSCGLLLASAIDWVRIQIFKKMKIEFLVIKLTKKISSMARNIFFRLWEEFV